MNERERAEELHWNNHAKRAWMRLTRFLDESVEDSMRIYEIRIKTLTHDGGAMVIIKGEEASGQRFVAFDTQPTAAAALESAVGRWEAGALKWKEDKPYAERNG